MSLENSDASGGDSDFEYLVEAPDRPPEKISNEVNFYIEKNHDKYSELSTQERHEKLRREYREELGKNEQQKWKKRHKKAKKRHLRLLQLYSQAHPTFDSQEYYKSQRTSSSNNRGRQNRGPQNRGPRKNGKKKRKRTRDNFEIQEYGSDGDNRNDNRNNDNRKTKHQKIDQIFKDLTASSSRRINPHTWVPKDHQLEQMKIFVKQMRQSARSDWQCNLNSEPAIHCLKQLDIVVAELSKKLFYKHYLDQTDILEALRDWMAALPDGSLPALKIRREIYRIIDKFALHEYEKETLEDYLKGSEDKAVDPRFKDDLHPKLKGFSKSLMNLWAHKQETTENKMILRKIMERWIRTLTGSDTSYYNLRQEMAESKHVIMQRYKTLQHQTRNNKFSNNKESKRARIPEKAWHDFAINPMNVIEDDDERNVTQQNPQNPFFNKKRNKRMLLRRNASKQAAVASITGK